MSLAPIFNEKSQILILGSYPSVISFNERFYYANPRNRFWPMLSAVFGEDLPQTDEQKCELILRHCLALWDVADNCVIKGSSDASIKNVTPNDLAPIFAKCHIIKVICNGAAAEKLYIKHSYMHNIQHIQLPSTSPANAAFSLNQLISLWNSHLFC